MIGRTNAVGGTTLNFKVVRHDLGAELPASASENTIAVFTDHEITWWEFNPSEPGNPFEGLVWFRTGTFSPVSFNVLKRNGIIICPLSAQQYIDGTWVVKDAQSYRGGEWVEWIPDPLYFIQNGDEPEPGVLYGKDLNASSIAGSNAPNKTVSDGFVIIKGTETGYCMYCFPVELGRHRTLKVDGEFSPGEATYLAVWSDIGQYIESNMLGYALLDTSGALMDISSLPAGGYYVGITSVYTNVQKIKNLYLE